jgi:hypothetical protein
MRARRALLLSAAAAVVVPVACLIIMQATDQSPAASELVLRFVVLVWPSAIMLMASQSPTPFAGVVALDPVLLMSLAANVLLYTLIGAAVWAGFTKRRLILVPVALVLVALWWRMWTL